MKSPKGQTSRRHVLQRTGTLLATSLAAPVLTVGEEPAPSRLSPLVEALLDGAPVRMDEAQLQSLQVEAGSVRKIVARLRKITLRNGDEPAPVFRA